MFLLFAAGIAFVVTGIVLVVRAIALPRLRMTTHLRQIETYGFKAEPLAEGALGPPPPLGRPINALAESAGRTMIASVPALRPISSRVLASAAFPALLFFEVVGTGGNLGVGILLVALAAACCWVLFGSVVRHRSETRLRILDQELPELIDVLIATIEAGLGFAGSLQLVAGRFEGPLGNELKLSLQEQRMGLSTNQALSNILERSDTPAMRSFVRAVVQGETLGVSIGTMMRNLALEMRTRRRQAAQERVQKAPLKMLFPLIFLIFPSMFIVLLYPAVHDLLAGFSRL